MAKNNLVLGLPPIYTGLTDPIISVSSKGGRVYQNLWGKVKRDNSAVTSSKLYPVKITVGTAEKTQIGVADIAMKTLKNGETIAEKLAVVEAELQAKEKIGLHTYKFGSATKNGKNAYVETMNSLMSMLAYGQKTKGTPDSQNLFYSKDFTHLSNFEIDEPFPSITFMASEETTITETASSEVGDSLLKKTLDIGKDFAREYNFITGGKGTSLDEINAFGEKMGGMAGTMINLGTDVARTIKDTATTVLGGDIVEVFLKGNQVVMPNVWKGSSFSKKYTLQFRFYTPYGADIAIHKNIIVPLMYLLGFSLPTQQTASTITFPYLIQVDSPGAFVIPMGIVTSLGIKKGGKYDLWNINGLFRSVDVTLEVSDLYEVLPAPADPLVGRMAQQTRLYAANLMGAEIQNQTDYNTMEQETYNKYFGTGESTTTDEEYNKVDSGADKPIQGSNLESELSNPDDRMNGATVVDTDDEGAVVETDDGELIYITGE